MVLGCLFSRGAVEERRGVGGNQQNATQHALSTQYSEDVAAGQASTKSDVKIETVRKKLAVLTDFRSRVPAPQRR